jgi:SAM-dependent methyltransferase
MGYFRAKIRQKFLAAQAVAGTFPKAPRMLDIGCGEGWVLAWFSDQGWEVRGLDYSRYACAHHNPAVADHMQEGDIPENIDRLVSAGEAFHIVWLDNVLEHSPDPSGLLRGCRSLLAPSGVLVVEVPNDFSPLQETVLRRMGRSEPFWIFHPDHLSYFNRDGLATLAAKAGLACRDVLGDYPIDLHLLCPSTDYVADRGRGKECHGARMAFELMADRISPERTNDLYRALGALGLGRQIIAFFQKVP